MTSDDLRLISKSVSLTEVNVEVSVDGIKRAFLSLRASHLKIVLIVSIHLLVPRLPIDQNLPLLVRKERGCILQYLLPVHLRVIKLFIPKISQEILASIRYCI